MLAPMPQTMNTTLNSPRSHASFDQSGYAAELVSWLAWTERDHMGLGSEARSSAELLPIAQLLIEWYSAAAPQSESG